MSKRENSPRPEPAAHEVTGEFRPEDLAAPAASNVAGVTGELTPQDLSPPAPAVSAVTGEFRPEDLKPPAAPTRKPAPAIHGVTGDFRPEDLAAPAGNIAGVTGEFTPQQLAAPAGNIGGLTGEFTAQQLAAPPGNIAGVTGEFTPEQLAPPAPPSGNIAGVTGEFSPQQLETDRRGRPMTSDGRTDVTGEFSAEELTESSGDHPTIARGPHHTTGPSAGARATSPAPPGAFPPVAPQMRTGRYALKRFFAKGGMGEIWLAEDCAINRPVALKKIRAGREDLRERFLLEAQITGQLEHPGVVPVHELGTDDSGQPFYAMRFIQGRTLQDALDEYHAAGQADVPKEVQQYRLLQAFINLCQTVAYAHSRGVIHRDLKPDNVMVGAFGETLLLDWGLAKVLGQPDIDDSAAHPTVAPPNGTGESAPVHAKTDPLAAYSHVRLSVSTESTATQAGSVKGTLGYMPPEAAEGDVEGVDTSSDIYLLGATLFHILTGRAPREGTNAVALVMEARKKQPPAPRTIKKDIPKPLDAICQKAMAFRKPDRYPTALALAEDLQRYMAGEPVSAYRETLTERTWRWMRRHRQFLSWATAVFLVLATGVFGFAKWKQVEAEREQERIEAARIQKETEEQAEQEKREKERLQAEEEARGRVQKFRRLGDELRFYAAIPDPAGEQAPAFYDQENGESKGRDALKLIEDWGLKLDGLPLADKRDDLRGELYDLLLLMAQMRGRRATDVVAGREMLALLDRAATLRPVSASYHRLCSRGHELVGEKEKAAQAKRLADDPKTPATALDHFLLGLAYQQEATRPADAQAESEAATEARTRRVRQAVEEYRLALALEPNHYWAHMNLGSSYLALGQPAEAAETLSACVALETQKPWGYSARGLALIAQKRTQDAIDDLDRAIKLSPEFRLPKLNRGIAYWMQQKYDQALADFDAVLEPPDNQRLIEGAYYRGQVHMDRGQYADALKAFDRVIAAKRSFPSLHLFRARALMAVGQQAQAMIALDQFIGADKAFDPESAEAYGRRGRLLRIVILPKLPPTVIRPTLLLTHAQLKKAVDLGARSATVYEDLGATLEQMGQTALAIDAYTESLKIAPKGVKVRVKRGWAYADLKPPQFDKAREDFATVVKDDPTHAEASAGLGYIQACRMAPAEARLAASRSLLHGAGDYLVLHNIACVYATLAQTDKDRATEYEDLAVDHVRRAVELWRKGGSKSPDEANLIRKEGAFPRSLKDRIEKEVLNPPAP